MGSVRNSAAENRPRPILPAKAKTTIEYSSARGNSLDNNMGHARGKMDTRSWKWYRTDLYTSIETIRHRSFSRGARTSALLRWPLLGVKHPPPSVLEAMDGVPV